MNEKYQYFNRDISWLSFNYRVLMEADDDSLPLYERINFIAIYSSNLEEFYQVRVAEHKAVASGGKSELMTVDEAHRLIHDITEIVNRQLNDRVRIYEQKILPALRAHHIYFYQTRKELPGSFLPFVHRYFMEEVFPYLQPVKVEKGMVRTFLRDKRLYLVARVRSRATGELAYYLLKMPYSKVPRFIELPRQGDDYCLMFLEDVIKANLYEIFVGYEVECSYCCKTSRDADVFVDDVPKGEMIEVLKAKVKKRKIGAICRFVYDRNMPDDFLAFLMDAFGISEEELVPGDKHLNLQDLVSLPNPDPEKLLPVKPTPMYLPGFQDKHFMFRRIAQGDFMLYYPYHSFNHFIHFLYEAVDDRLCTEVLITQYRVAENSEVVNALIMAARKGKRVTVFVELKARFDEENNLATAERMRKAGIEIIYSIPGLKVHAKTALVVRQTDAGTRHGFACVSTGNFNEKTSKVYADIAYYTHNQTVVRELYGLFQLLRGEIKEMSFRKLLVARFNLLPQLQKLIRNEIAMVKKNKRGRIILKMNALQDMAMIEELYRASEAGVEIDLIVRGICCLIPGQPYSRNIRVTRIVDSFLEHARVWYFENGGAPKMFIGSPDWMRRNLYRRIELVIPISNKKLQHELMHMLELQLSDNVKGGWVDGCLNNIPKEKGDKPEVRAQYDFYAYLKEKL